MKITKFVFPTLNDIILGQYESYEDGEITIKYAGNNEGARTDEAKFHVDDDPHYYAMEANDMEISQWMNIVSNSLEFTESIN